MILTEKEARSKWCHAARVAGYMELKSGDQVFVANCVSVEPKLMAAGGNARNPPSARCIASDCMGWRWKVLARGEAWATDEAGALLGYCGLAGPSTVPNPPATGSDAPEAS